MPLSYQDAVQWYYAFARFDAKSPRETAATKLARMEQILVELGEPQTQYPSILIAGTKGKGSTAALIERMLRAAGYRTGLFTSPHLSSFRERVRVNGEWIREECLVEITEQLQEIAPRFPDSSFFGWVTALAFQEFARAQVDVAVVEVGLGGRLDCTNVLKPRAAVITAISYDHTEILGETLEKIAYEKAGIIKPATPVIVAPQKPEAMEVIETVAREQNAPLVDVATESQWEPVWITRQGQSVLVRQVGQKARNRFQLPLLGPHQRINLATALATIQTLRKQGWNITARQMHEGVKQVEWHARFEILPLGEPNRRAVIDGAHNRAWAHELVRTLDEVFLDSRVHFVFGASGDKDIAGMLAELAPRAASFIFTRAATARAAAPEALAELAGPYGVASHIAEDVAHALEPARRIALAEDVVCITGSLFVAAEARALLAPVVADP